METETAPETVVPESVAEALPVVETVKTEAAPETPAAPTLADFEALTADQQKEVRRELEKINDAKNNAAAGRGNLYPSESKGGKGVRVGDFPKGKSPAELAAKETPAAPVAEVPAAEEPAKVEPAAETEAEKTKQFRIRGSDIKGDPHLNEAFLALLRAGKTPVEASAAIYGTAAPKTEEAAPTAEGPTVEETFDKEISTLQTEIAKLEKDQEAAADEADVAKALKIARQITAKERAIENKQLAKDMAVQEQQETVAKTVAQKEAEIAKTDYASVVEDYPELGDKASAERKKFDEFVRERQNDPRYEGKFASLHWRSSLAHEFAAKSGLKPAALRTAFEPPAVKLPAKTTPPPAAKSASQATAAKALTTKDAPSSDTFELTPEQATKEFANLTVQQQREVMRELEKMQQAKNRRVA